MKNIERLMDSTEITLTHVYEFIYKKIDEIDLLKNNSFHIKYLVQFLKSSPYYQNSLRNKVFRDELKRIIETIISVRYITLEEYIFCLQSLKLLGGTPNQKAREQ